ncbi:MAG: M23 family metallopeptidase [Caldisericia bacterium]|nr:M23 family metallopeptidase [Caldisericia bacterium]
MLQNRTNKKNSKLLIVPANNSKPIQIEISKTLKTSLFVLFVVLTISLIWFGSQYAKFKGDVVAFNDRFEYIMNSSDKDLSNEIKIKKALIKLEATADATDLFIIKASDTETEACKKLELPYSSKEFSDFIVAERNSLAKAQPASITESQYVNTQNHNNELESSIQRQEAINANMKITPTGLPVIGIIVNHGYVTAPGIEIYAPYGTYVRATASGEISELKAIFPGIYTIEIIHKNEDLNTTISRYLFCIKPFVDIGDSIEKGQVIAKVGYYHNTTNSIVGYQLLVNNLLVEP